MKIDLEWFSSKIISIGSSAPNEEKLKIEIEKLLSSFLESLNITIDPSYEYTFLSGHRADALYGHVIIEYEPPRTLKSSARKNKAINQVKDYIKQAAAGNNFHKFFGIVLDGQQIIFVRFIQSKLRWEISKSFNIDIRSMGRVIAAISALRRKPIDAEFMIQDFGPTGPIASQFIKTLYYVPLNKPKSQILFDDWKRIFHQISSYTPKKFKGLEKNYGIKNKNNGIKTNIDYQKLLFCVHKYYSVVMKLIAAEVVVLYGGGKFIDSFISRLIDAETVGKLKDEIELLEGGVLFQDLNFAENFVEGDYFSWYLSEWNDDIHTQMISLINKISEYEVATTDLEPERVRDLFKHLYQELIPRSIRLGLGEYYTPDWLVELVLDTSHYTMRKFESLQKEIDSTSPLNLRLLDPACGSGTFLVFAIKRIKEYAESYFIEPKKIIDKITSNIIGFDLNPLAVIASRTNYLLALGDLLRDFRGKEIPIFLANSIIAEESSTIFGKMFRLQTIVGDFSFPSRIIEENLLGKLLSIIDDKVRRNYNTNEFRQRLKIELPNIEEEEEESILTLYNLFLNLEREGKNRIWTNILKNSFAPLFKGKFDFIVGNPPWISWDNLPLSYRETLEVVWNKIWKSHKIVDKPSGGAFKKDISSLFVAYCLTKYMKDDNGILGFLLPFTLFKTQSHARFRRYLADSTKIETIHDLVSLKPFEGAVNRTSMLVCSRGLTKFPLNILSWDKKNNGKFSFFSSLSEVKRNTDRFELIMEPIEGKGLSESSWMMLKKGALIPVRKALGKSNFVAHEGINTRGCNGVFYVDIIDKNDDQYLIQNLHEVGREEEEIEEKVEQKRCWVEKDLIFPLLRGRNVERWHSQSVSFIMVPFDQTLNKVIDEKTLKINFEKSYDFLWYFKKKLENRTFYGKIINDEKHIVFYKLFQINKNSFNKIKVVWKELSGSISGKGDLAAATSISLTSNDKEINNKCNIIDHKLMSISCNNEDEAYFITGILNSSISRLIVASYTIETSISTHLLKYIRIPSFEPNNEIHVSIVKESRKAHEIYSDPTQLKNVEENLDTHMCKLYNINKEEFKSVKESLDILIR